MRRFVTVLLATALAVAFASAAFVAVAHWTPGGLVSHDTYNAAFTVHSMAWLVLMPAVLLLLAEGEPPPAIRPAWLVPAAWLALGVQALVLVVRISSTSDARGWWQTWSGFALFPPCLLVGAALLWRWGERMRAREVALGFAALVQMFGLGFALPIGLTGEYSLEHPTLTSLGQTFTGALVEATALAAVTVAVAEREQERGPWLAVLTLAGTLLVPESSRWRLLLAPIAAIGALWLLALALRRHRLRQSAAAWAFTALAALAFFESTSLVQLLRLLSVNVHLHDTYFVVGLLHLRVVSCLFAGVAVTLRRRPQEDARALLGSAAALSLVGSQLLCFAMLVCGSRGMPRRYFEYLAEFQTLHRVIAIGGGLLILGAILALIRPRPALTRTTPHA